MAGRDTRRDAAGGRRASPDQPDPYREFWDHPGRSRRGNRKSGRTRRSDVPQPAAVATRPAGPTRSTGRVNPPADLPWYLRGDQPEEQPRRTAHRSPKAAKAAKAPQPHKPSKLSKRDKRAMQQVRVQMPPPPGYRSRTDGLTTGAVVVVFVVGLSLLAVVENNLLTGGASSDNQSPAAADRPVKKPGPKRTGAEPPRSAPQPPPVQTLTKGVGELTLQLRGPAARQSYGADKAPLTGATRWSADRTWAFGTAAIPVPADRPAMPHVTLYLAHWTGGKWRIALSGTPEFTRLLNQVPVRMMPAEERGLLARYSTVSGGANAKPEGLMLPWKVGATWSMDATPGGRGPLDAVSFRGGDGTVAAAGPGRLYRFCAVAPGRGMVMVIHPNGVASTYYHLTDVARVRDGAFVARGTRLGRTGVDRPCGGAPVDRPQVRFALRRGNDDIPFAGVQLGGWIFRQRAEPLVGWAERGPDQIMPGGELRNFGPVAPPDPPKEPGDPPGGGRPTGSPSPKDNQERNTSGDPQQ